MDHTATLRHSADTYFSATLEMSFDSLLAPIDSASPAGIPIHDTPLYHALRRARHTDDDSLPMGAWVRELKRPDWPSASLASAEVLQCRSKDLQCVAWLLEARLHLDGFTAIAPCLTLLDALLLQYWDTLHPQAEGGNLEHRASVIAWIGEKLLPLLHLTPITASSAGTQYNWADREQALRYAQVRSHARAGQQTDDGVTLASFRQGVAETGSDYYLQQQRTLSDALQALAALSATLEHHFGNDAPSMAAMAAWLEQLQAFTEDELHARSLQARDEASASAPAAPASPLAACAGGIRDRDDAYAKLAELADYLMRLEPHNPVPHLLRRAVQWSKLDTGRLYHELFIRSNGTLSIAELFDGEASDRQA